MILVTEDSESMQVIHLLNWENSLELELEDEDVDSVGGLFAKELGRLPGRGDEVSVSGLV